MEQWSVWILSPSQFPEVPHVQSMDSHSSICKVELIWIQFCNTAKPSILPLDVHVNTRTPYRTYSVYSRLIFVIKKVALVLIMPG